MCQASLVTEVVRILKKITLLLNKSVDYCSQISWVVAIVGINGITSHHTLKLVTFDLNIIIRCSGLRDWGYKNSCNIIV